MKEGDLLKEATVPVFFANDCSYSEFYFLLLEQGQDVLQELFKPLQKADDNSTAYKEESPLL